MGLNELIYNSYSQEEHNQGYIDGFKRGYLDGKKSGEKEKS